MDGIIVVFKQVNKSESMGVIVKFNEIQNNNSISYFHRYVCSTAFMLIPWLLYWQFDLVVFLTMGSSLILFAVYTLLGYLFHFEHIYCCYQNAYHQKMIPNRIDWSEIRKVDAYGIPTLVFLFGIILITCSLYGVGI